jgi:hypothetical protein
VESLSAAGTIALSFLFAAAVIGKVDGWRDWSALALRIAPRGGRAIAFGVPAAELTTATALVVSPVRGAFAAAALLLVLAITSYHLWQTMGPAECNCFGPLLPGVFGPRLVVRNVVLAVGAGVTALVAAAYPPVLGTAVYAVAAAYVLVLFLLFEAIKFRRIAAQKEINT